MHECALLDGAPPAEPEDLGLGARGKHLGWLVLGVEHEEIVGGLLRCDPRLHGGVVLEAAMAVEVVLRNVQHHGDVRAKLLDRLQLEAGDLEDAHRRRRPR